MSKKHTSLKKKNKHKVSQPYIIQGTLDVTRSGIGYVIPEKSTDKTHDVLIRPADFNHAFNGDSVRVKVTKENVVSGRREGKILEITERKQTEFVGVLQLSEKFAFFTPNSDKPIVDFYIPIEKINGCKNGDKVIVRFTGWGSKNKNPSGEVLSLLTAESENDMTMKSLLSENGFPIAFNDEVIKESEQLSTSISKAEITKRRDFRNTLTFTIDPEDAKDFDDAVSIKKLSDGWLEIGVHIADVSHYVQPGTALDNEAYHRATSVYLPDRVNPMLPENISNVLCSLRPHENKLTFSAVFIMNEKGKIKDTWLGKTVIHSDHRFTYEDVQDIIEQKTESKYQVEILLLNELAQALRKKRFEKGAINFSSQEVRFKLDETGKPIGVVLKESKESHQLVEELMLLANKGVAEYISKIKIDKKPVPFPYRIHDQP
ncbi:MAG: ribonuclease R, partial [Chitinophagaceae bacterium]|nr:ribonuclease R [Chitinophagaceae bacterium]